MTRTQHQRTSPPAAAWTWLWLWVLVTPGVMAHDRVTSHMPASPPLCIVHFAFGDDRLSASAHQALRRLVLELRESGPPRPLRVTGYTDDIGPQDYNEALARRRARAVRQALIEAGLEAQGIALEVRAKAGYLASNETAEGRARNRRAEIGYDAPASSPTPREVLS
ncbi:MAG TPA: OmpA family protein [Thiohalobacter sp.]|nr:OmpA family protein [Thiohalobacter sp.]